jgi:hypothetical protein
MILAGQHPPMRAATDFQNAQSLFTDVDSGFGGQ